MTDKKKRLLLIDGNSIMNRSFYALAGRSSLSAPDGTPTGALHTYLNTLQRFMDEVSPTHICTLFDRKEKTFRHTMYDGYKAKRKPMPEELAVQMKLIKDILDALNQERYELPGYEADDLIGTLARQGEKDGYDVWILSGDKDDFQLVDDHTVVLMPVTRPGKSVTELYDRAALLERYQIQPEDFVTLKAIMGDPSDNIPGVKGIGEKGAIELVRAYKTLDSIYENLDSFSAGVRKKLEESKEMAYLSYELSQIECQVPLEKKLSDCEVKEPDTKVLFSLLQTLGLKSQLKKWNIEGISPEMEIASSSMELPQTAPNIQKNPTPEVFLAAFEKARRQDDFQMVFDMPFPSEVEKEDAFFMISFSDTDFFSFSVENALLYLSLLAEKGVGKEMLLPVGHSIKNRFKYLSSSLPFSSCFDTEIAGYVLNQIEGAAPTFSLLFERATKTMYPVCPFLPEKEDKSPIELLFAEVEEKADEAVFQSVWRSMLLRRMAIEQKKKIKEDGLETLLYEIEMPLLIHLDRMERNGVLVDCDILSSIHEDMEKRIETLTKNIYEMTGEEFNIQSPKQLSEVLFEKMGLKHGRKNSSSGTYSTALEELTKLLDSHPVISEIIHYRQLTKLDSTFVLGLQKVIDPVDRRVHSNFSQVMTQTGRLSSAEPNLQNIPIRSEEGRLIRKAFVSEKGYVLVDADYSQIELRLLAHLSADPQMQKAFLDGEDIHTNTAARIFGVEKKDVLPYMRSAAKTVNFSIVYGISDFGLSQDLGISFSEAHRYIEQYYTQYPKIKEYLDSLKAVGNEKGYVETIFKRKRILKELSSPNRNIRSFGERAAMNTPVQGTAADIIKIAMNQVSSRLLEEKLDAKLILQVHDELLVECKEEISEKVSSILKESMEKAKILSVPLVAEVTVGTSWYECKYKE